MQLALISKKLIDQNRFPEALAAWDEIMRHFESTKSLLIDDTVASILAKKGEMLARMNLGDEALTVWEGVIHRFGPKRMESPQLQNAVSLASLGRGMVLTKSNRLQEAAAVYDEMLSFESADTKLESIAPIALALLAKGGVLVRLKRSDAALTVWNDLIRRFATSVHPPYYSTQPKWHNLELPNCTC